MSRRTSVLSLPIALLIVPQLLAQGPGSDATRPSFEVASVKLNKSGGNGPRLIK